MWSSCFGSRKSRRAAEEAERQPLLPRYNDDTSREQRLREKLHSYLMIRALVQGYMPSNKQVITSLRTLLSKNALNPDDADLSPSGQALVRNTKLWLQQFIELLQHKNTEDQVQDFIWYLAKARLTVDTEDLGARVSKAKSKADTAAAYRSLQTVGSLLLTNSDFRIFLSDLTTIGREVLSDTASTLGDVSKQAAKQIEPPKDEQEALKHPNGGSKQPVSNEDLKNDAIDVSKIVGGSAAKVAEEAQQSIKEHMTGDEQETLVYRLKQTVTKLRSRRDYSDSVSTLSLLIRRYLLTYSHVVEETMEAAEQDVGTNPEADRAVKNFWLLLTSFGSAAEWKEVERLFGAVIDHGRSDPQFDELVREIGNLVQDMLTNADFFDNAERRFQDLRAKSRELATESSVREDLDAFLTKLHLALHSVLEDVDLKRLLHTTKRIATILSPAHQYTNTALVSDAVNVFVPAMVQAVQHVPIPRVEVSTPDVDLLLENLILEPGHTVNDSSFLPHKLRITTLNDIEIRKARFRTTSSMSSVVTITISGLSIAAEELGFWLRLHSGILRLADEGIAGFHLDERGIDISLDVEIGKERLEQVLTLRDVRVHIHHLNYELRKSKFAFFAWILKPFIRPTVRLALQSSIATAISEGLHFANREFIYARERLRATRIADPSDLWTFIRAVTARLVPEEDPDLHARVGVAQPGRGVFKGVYAPGSLVKLWNEEATMAGQRVQEYERDGWRNDIFNVPTTPV